MSGVDFGKQVGPLPLGAWVAVVAGGLGIAIYTRRNQAGSGQVQVVADTGADPGVGLGGAGWVSVQPPATGVTSAQPQTNEEWARLATTYLIAQGYDPGVADSAVRKYMEANQLTAQEYAMMSMVLRQYGPPPNPIGPPADPPVVTTPPPSTGGGNTPAPTTTAMRYVTVTVWPSQTGTLWGIAQKYYNNGSRWIEIYNANKRGVTRPDGTQGWITNPDLIWPGRTVWVP